MFQAFLNAFRVPEIRKRIFFTFGILLLYRLGTFIPTPGVDLDQIRTFLSSQAGGVFGIINLFSGGNFERFSIFALGILPYITAAIIMQILTTAVPALEKLQREGEEGRRVINQYTRYAAIGCSRTVLGHRLARVW